MPKSSNVGFYFTLLLMDDYCTMFMTKFGLFNGIRHMRLFPVVLLLCIIDVNQSFYLIMQQNESCVYSVLLKSNQQTSLVSALSNIIILAKHLYNLCIYC